MQLEIPAALPTWNIFYAGRHWTERVKLKEHWVAMTLDALPDECELFQKPVHISVYGEYKRTAPDADNVCAKMVIDALKGKVLVDDKPQYVAGISFYPRKSERDYTTIVLTEV